VYVEDVFAEIALRLSNSRRAFGGKLANEWHLGFIASVNAQLLAGRALSVAQSEIVLRILRTVETDLAKDHANIGKLLQSPQFRQTPYQSVRTPREVRFMGDNVLGFRGKSDHLLTKDIKNSGGNDEFTLKSRYLWMRPQFDWTYKIWLVRVNRFNLYKVKAFIAKHHFQTDEAVEQFLQDCTADLDAASICEVQDDVLILRVKDNELLAHWALDNAQSLSL
jgi:hypothetical protein